MKKIFLLLLLCISLSTEAQKKKRVADETWGIEYPTGTLRIITCNNQIAAKLDGFVWKTRTVTLKEDKRTGQMYYEYSYTFTREYRNPVVYYINSLN